MTNPSLFESMALPFGDEVAIPAPPERQQTETATETFEIVNLETGEIVAHPADEDIPEGWLTKTAADAFAIHQMSPKPLPAVEPASGPPFPGCDCESVDEHQAALAAGEAIQARHGGPAHDEAAGRAILNVLQGPELAPAVAELSKPPEGAGTVTMGELLDTLGVPKDVQQAMADAPAVAVSLQTTDEVEQMVEDHLDELEQDAGAATMRPVFMIDSEEKLTWFGLKLVAKDAEIKAAEENSAKLIARLKKRREEFASMFMPQAEAFVRDELRNRASGKKAPPKFMDTVGGRWGFRKVAAKIRVTNADELKAWARINRPEMIHVSEPVESVPHDQVQAVWKETGEAVPGTAVTPARESFYFD